MKINAFLGAAGALALVPAIAAADPMTDRWLGQATAAVEAQLKHAGIETGSHVIDVKVRVESEGRLSSPQLIRLTGSTDLDASLVRAVRKADVPAPPAILSGRAIVLHLGVSDNQIAQLNAAHTGTN